MITHKIFGGVVLNWVLSVLGVICIGCCVIGEEVEETFFGLVIQSFMNLCIGKNRVGCLLAHFLIFSLRKLTVGGKLHGILLDAHPT